jgi:hypothetical protein
VWLGRGLLRSSSGGRQAATVAVEPGTVRHLPAGSDELLEVVDGSPRAMFFEFK